MKILLFSRSGAAHSAKEVRQIFDSIAQHGFEWAVNEEFAAEAATYTGQTIPTAQTYGAQIGAQQTPCVMVCYGGDGTLLEGAHRLRGAEIPVAGINSGRLGFLTSVSPAETDHLFDDIAQGRIRTEPRTLLNVDGGFAETPESHLALNELSIQRHGAAMVSVDAYVDDQMVATYHGDGVLVCTPTGSTAYSLSAGGPVVSPRCGCFVITPLAPHNLTMRPVVVPDTSTITLHIRPGRANAFVTLDNRTYPIQKGATFTVHRSEHRIFLAIPHNISFYDTLRNKMMWGIDIRS